MWFQCDRVGASGTGMPGADGEQGEEGGTVGVSAPRRGSNHGRGRAEHQQPLATASRWVSE